MHPCNHLTTHKVWHYPPHILPKATSILSFARFRTSYELNHRVHSPFCPAAFSQPFMGFIHVIMGSNGWSFFISKNTLLYECILHVQYVLGAGSVLDHFERRLCAFFRKSFGLEDTHTSLGAEPGGPMFSFRCDGLPQWLYQLTLSPEVREHSSRSPPLCQRLTLSVIFALAMLEGYGVVDHCCFHLHLSDDKWGSTPLFIGHLDIFFCWWFAQGFFSISLLGCVFLLNCRSWFITWIAVFGSQICSPTVQVAFLPS